MIIEVKSVDEMKAFGERLGKVLASGEVIELVGDVGAGKTTLTKGIAKGLDVHVDIQSPSFTINRLYNARNDLLLTHYDFYRLDDPGIMKQELDEAIRDNKAIVVIEWGDIVSGVLPTDRLTVTITATNDHSRQITLTTTGEKSRNIEHQL